MNLELAIVLTPNCKSDETIPTWTQRSYLFVKLGNAHNKAAYSTIDYLDCVSHQKAIKKTHKLPLYH